MLNRDKQLDGSRSVMEEKLAATAEVTRDEFDVLLEVLDQSLRALPATGQVWELKEEGALFASKASGQGRTLVTITCSATCAAWRPAPHSASTNRMLAAASRGHMLHCPCAHAAAGGAHGGTADVAKHKKIVSSTRLPCRSPASRASIWQGCSLSTTSGQAGRYPLTLRPSDTPMAELWLTSAPTRR